MIKKAYPKFKAEKHEYSTKPPSKKKLLIPFLLITFGVAILVYQGTPYAKYYMELNFSDKYASFISPIPGHVAGDSFGVPNPGQTFSANYFAEILSELNITDTSGNYTSPRAPAGAGFEGTFKLSIPSVGIVDMPVEANVDSYDSKTYDNVLRRSAAHFKGTDLPVDNSYHKGANTFIYAHSAPNSWATFNRRSYQAAFNPLFDANIGDEITIKHEDKTYIYKIKKIKISQPNDLSMLLARDNKISVTLMTCAPPGSIAKRLNVIADLEEVI